MGNPVFSCIWLVVLIFISFFVALFCAGWYILFHPLSVCIPPCSQIAEILLAGVQFPHYCAERMMQGAPFP